MSRTHRSGHYEDDRNSRDKKKWYKANSEEKRHVRNYERAIEDDYMRHLDESEDEFIPHFRKSNNKY